MRDTLVFELPSTGQLVKARALSAEQVDLLASNKPYQNLSDILSQLIIPECLGLSYEVYEKFLLGDHLSCLVAIRRATWGDVFEYKLPCPHCSREGNFRVDLSKLKIKHLDPEQPRRNLECVFSGEDGKVSEIVVWKLPTVGDSVQKISEHLQYIEENKSKQNFTLTFTVAMHIQDIMIPRPGVENPNIDDPTQFVSRFPGKSGFALRNAIRNYVRKSDAAWMEDFLKAIEGFDCGAEIEVDHECANPSCGKMFNANLPLEETFFVSSRKSSRSSDKARRSQVRTPWKKEQAASPEEQMTTSQESSSDTRFNTSSSEDPSSPTSP